MNHNKEIKWLKAAESLANIFSTCSRRKYCAIILSKDGRVAGMGYNGGPSGMIHCDDGGCPRALSDVKHGSLYDNCIAIHAEANALLWSDHSMRHGGTLIINGPPCYGCAKLISSSGIKTVICQYDENYEKFQEIVDYLMSQDIQVKINLKKIGEVDA